MISYAVAITAACLLAFVTFLYGLEGNINTVKRKEAEKHLEIYREKAKHAMETIDLMKQAYEDLYMRKYDGKCYLDQIEAQGYLLLEAKKKIELLCGQVRKLYAMAKEARLLRLDNSALHEGNAELRSKLHEATIQRDANHSRQIADRDKVIDAMRVAQTFNAQAPSVHGLAFTIDNMEALQAMLAQSQRTITYQHTANKNLDAKIRQTIAERDEANSRCKNMSGSIDGLARENEGLRQMHEADNKACAEQNDRTAALYRNLERINGTVKAMRANIDERDKKVAELTIINRLFIDEKEDVSKKYADEFASFRKMMQSAMGSEEQARQLTKQVKNQVALIEDRDKAIETLKLEVQNGNQVSEKLKTQLHDARSNYARLRKKYDAAKELVCRRIDKMAGSDKSSLFIDEANSQIGEAQ